MRYKLAIFIFNAENKKWDENEKKLWDVKSELWLFICICGGWGDIPWQCALWVLRKKSAI